MSQNSQSNANGHCDATGCDAVGARALRNDALGDASLSTVSVTVGALALAERSGAPGSPAPSAARPSPSSRGWVLPAARSRSREGGDSHSGTPALALLGARVCLAAASCAAIRGDRHTFRPPCRIRATPTAQVRAVSRRAPPRLAPAPPVPRVPRVRRRAPVDPRVPDRAALPAWTPRRGRAGPRRANDSSGGSSGPSSLLEFRLFFVGVGFLFGRHELLLGIGQLLGSRELLGLEQLVGCVVQLRRQLLRRRRRAGPRLGPLRPELLDGPVRRQRRLRRHLRHRELRLGSPLHLGSVHL